MKITTLTHVVIIVCVVFFIYSSLFLSVNHISVYLLLPINSMESRTSIIYCKVVAIAYQICGTSGKKFMEQSCDSGVVESE